MNTRENYRESGHALLTAMVLITLMAILSVAGLRSALLESRVSDVQRQQELAFQQAESVLTYGRNDLLPVHLDSQPAAQTGAVQYPVPAAIAATDYHADYALPVAPPTITLRTLSRRGSLVSKQRNQDRHASAWVELNVTAYGANGRAAVKLREIVLRSAMPGNAE